MAKTASGKTVQSRDEWKKNQSSGGSAAASYNSAGAVTSSGKNVQSRSEWRASTGQRGESTQGSRQHDPFRSFLTEANRFFQGAEKEINNSKGFDAAEFFESRKRQGDVLKNWAADLSSFIDNHADSYTPEYYDYTKSILATFDTDVDDVLSYYQPSVNAKAGMRAYEDEYLAYQEKQKNSQLPLAIQAGMMPEITNPAYGFINMQNQYRADNSHLQVSDQWTDDEKFQLGLLQQEDPAKAKEFARQVNDYHNAKSTEEQRKGIRDAATQNFGAGALHTAGALGTSALFGMPEFLDRVAEYTARGTTTEKAGLMPSDYSAEVTGGISQHLNDKYGTIREGVPILGGKGVGDLYNMGYSIGQNLLSRYTLGAVGGKPLVLASYFANAATSGIDEARRRGANGDQALASGIAKGTWEVATELFGLDNLFKMGPAVTWGDLFKQIGIQGVFEASGEGLNTALGYITDNYILGDLSEYQQNVQHYKDKGESDSDAKWHAFLDAAQNVGYDALSGAVSGWVIGGTETVYKTGKANQYYRNIDAQALIDEAMDTSVEGKAYQMAEGMQKKVDAGEKISGNDKRMLAYNTELMQLAEEKVNAEAAARDDLMMLGQVENLEQLAEIVAKRSRGEKLTRSDRKAIRGNENVQQLFETMDSNDSEEEMPTVSTQSVEAEVPQMQVAEDGRARQISTNTSVDLQDFASIDNGKATIRLKDGGTADMDDIAFANDTETRQFATVASLPGIEAEAANAVLAAMVQNETGNTVESSSAIRDAYQLGLEGYQMSDMNAEDAAHIPLAMQAAAFEAGRTQRAITATAIPTVSKKATTKPTGDYKKVVIEGKGINLNKKQQAEVSFMDFVADNFSGTTVHVYASYKGLDGKFYYRDSNGQKQSAPNGRYVGDEIWVDLNSGTRGEGLVLNTFGHEMYHHIEKWSKPKANELAEFLIKELGKDSVDSAIKEQIEKATRAGYGVEYFKGKGMTQDQAENMVRDRAMSDFVADSLETMFTRGNPAEAIAKLKSENRSLFDKIKAFVDDFVSKLRKFYKDKTISKEGEWVAQLESFEKIQQMFMEAMADAGDNYRAAMEAVVTENAEAVDTDEIQTDGAFVTDGEGTMYSIRSMKSDIADGQMFEDLKTYCDWTQAQVDTFRNQLADLVEYMTPYRNILDLNETYGREGRRFSPYKPNSDPLYKISMDFSTLCSKRLLTQYVIENLQLRENRPMTAEEQMAIRDMLNEYRKQEKGLQVACAMCYVEAARLKSPKQMKKWLANPESYMRNYFADKDPDFAAYIKGKQGDFKESRGYARNATKKEMSSKDVTELNKIRPRLRAEYKPSAAEEAIIAKAKALPASTYLTAANLANLSESDPTIYAAYTSFVRTATRSKSLETDEPYYYGDSTRDNGNGIVVTDEFIEAVNRENGMRFSSWSDWRIQHMLDYITAVIDNSVRGAAMHGYTKFPEEVRVLGNTGMMFNMSGVAGTQTGLNEDGTLSFSETESIDKDEAVKLREEFPETAGLQCIGVSDQHIVELLKSDIIDYVIPYHVSGLNKGLRSMANIQGWKNYTSTQHAAIDKDVKLADAVDQEHWREEPVFSEFFVGYDTGMTGIEAMRASADKYKQMCNDRGLKPKFEQFAEEPNYWKLLIDRKMINQKTGELIRQKPVTPSFDFDAIKAVVDRHVANYDSNMESRALNHIVENWDSIPKRIRDLKKQGGKKPLKKSVDVLSNQTLAAQSAIEKEPDGEHRNSLRNDVYDSPRSILARALASEAKTPVDRDALKRYQDKVGELNRADIRLRGIRDQIAELSVDEKANRKQLSELRNEERSLQRKVDYYDRKLLGLESTAMMKRIVEEERKKAADTVTDFKAAQKARLEEQMKENRAVRDELTGRTKDVSIMEQEFIRLVKEFDKEKVKGQKLSDKLKQAAVQKENADIWEQEFQRLLREYEASGRKIERLEQTISRQRATAKARVEGRRNTEMRHKIQRKADELNRLLVHGTKHRNIPEFLQPAVADIMESINMEVRDGEQRRRTYEQTLERYDQRIAAETDPTKVTELIEKRNAYAAKGDQFANKMEGLKKAYDQIREGKVPNMELDEGLSDALNTLFEKVGNTPLGQMTAAQLEAVNDVLNITMATVRNANKLLAEERSAGVEENSKAVMREVRSIGGETKKKPAVLKKIEQFGWNNLKPVQAFEVIGSEKLTGLFKNLRKGEDTLGNDLAEGKAFFQNQWKKHGADKWDMEKKWKFTSTSGRSFELDLEQIMSLYALSKRDQARSHLRVGGFSFDSQYQTEEKVKIGPVNLKVKMESTDASAYNLSDEILGEIIGKLTPQQRSFVDEMQGYLSKDMAAKGNEISLKKYGIRLFKESNYFPLRVADQYMAKVREQQNGDRKLKDSGFTKEVTPEAKNPVVLSAFTKVWAEHVDEMSLYHSFVLPLDDLNRVLNYHDQFMEEESSQSVVEAIRNAYGKGATDYIDKLIKDVNGGARTDSVASTLNSMMSKAKKAQTMASLSVAIQQPSAIMRSMAMIDPKYFVGPKVTEKTHDRTWDEMKKYSGICHIKEMGGFDTNVGQSTVDYLTDTASYDGFGDKFKALFTDGKFRDDALGRFPAWMDEVTWGAIWNAVKREQADLHPTMNTNSRAFMEKVSERFEDVIVHTQVYDSVFSRSGLMRSKDTGMKMATAFMAEPATTANMLALSILNAKRGGKVDRAQLVRTTSAIVGSLIVNSALVSIAYALRDDDEDKRLGEKWLENFRENFFESLNPMGYIPVVRDIQSMMRGFDVERSDMALYGDLINAIRGLGDDKVSALDKVEAVVGSVGNLLGVPLKNMIRDGKGVFNTIRIALQKDDPATKTGRYMALTGKDLNDGEQLLLAIQRGDDAHIQRVAGRFENQQKAESALQSAIKQQYISGKVTAEDAAELLIDNFDDRDENDVYWILDQWDYAKDNGSAEGYTKYGRLREAIANGEGFEAEIDRYMEHGAEASDIRSEISRTYRKQYLEAGEEERTQIREKIMPAYLYTGMDEADVLDKFNDWDFEAQYGMTYSQYKAEYREGTVTEAQMREAMDSYGLMNYEIEENIRDLNEEIAFVNRFGMSMSEMYDAYDDGDVTRNSMIAALKFRGKTDAEARKELSQRDIESRFGIDYAKLDDAYKYGDISRQEFYNAMIENGSTRQEVDEAILGYDWLKKNIKKHPDLAISDARRFVLRVSDKMEERTLADFGVSIEAYKEYVVKAKDCPGVDADGDGKIDSYSKAKQLFAMIDQLPISNEAKDGLAYITNAKSTIKKYAPWH